jgi:hypothetical protein
VRPGQGHVSAPGKDQISVLRSRRGARDWQYEPRLFAGSSETVRQNWQFRVQTEHLRLKGSARSRCLIAGYFHSYFFEDFRRYFNRSAGTDSKRHSIGCPGAHIAPVRKHQIRKEYSIDQRCDAGAEEPDVYCLQDVTEKIVRKRTERDRTLLGERGPRPARAVLWL